MSSPSETGGRPLASDTKQPPSPHRRRTTSQSSDERTGGNTSSTSRRRPAPKKGTPGPHTGPSRGQSSAMQRSTSPARISPEMAAVNYTRTGRISKAKKGLKVHNCECGRSYTRAEHLRRHQKNHAPSPLICELPGCGKTFFRLDLLQRHQERHNEPEKDSRRPSYISEGTAPDAEPQCSPATSLPSPIATSLPQQDSPYYQPAVSPHPEATTPPSQPKERPTGARQGMSIAVPVEGVVPTGIAWNDPFSQSPYYSSSSGYGSPVPGGQDHTNIFANHPYGSGLIRTRTSSDASFYDSWNYPPESPTSATSTMPFTWSSNDKTAPATLAFAPYPLTSMPMVAEIESMGGYLQYGPKSMAQRDGEEQAFLFPEQTFGMRTADIFPFEHYLDNYWRLFHPALPIVHRPTFERVEQSPMLRAAMAAIGAQYSSEPGAKQNSRMLHDRCLKLLDKRHLDVMTEDDRLCDDQAVFLVEVLSQYRAKRAATTLSARFETLYEKFSQDVRGVSLKIIEILSTAVQLPNASFDLWTQWVELASRQRILQCCYILEYQQAVLLARLPQPSMLQYAGYDLPIPSHSSLWSADNLANWVLAAQQQVNLPTFVYEVAPTMSTGPLDEFQSLLLIAVHYNHFNNPAIYLAPPAAPAIEHFLDNSPRTKHALLTAKLLQVTPIRALLAVAGESWILFEKVPTAAAFQGSRCTLKAWLAAADAPNQHPSSVKQAVKLSIELLQHAIDTSAADFQLALGADMGLYFAALVIWAVTLAAQPQPVRIDCQSPISATGQFLSTSEISSADPIHPSTTGLLQSAFTSAQPPAPGSEALYYDHTPTAIEFLQSAFLEVDFMGLSHQWPRDITYWQQGSVALMRWVKLRLQNGFGGLQNSTITRVSTSTSPGHGADGHGECLNSVLGVLDKILTRSWEGRAI